MLAELGRRFSAMQCTVVESSVTMIGQCRATVEAVPGLSTRCEWVVDDVFCWIESGGVNRARYDLIVTCFFLDCFDPPELERLIYGISSRIPSGAIWLVADFSIPTHGPARWRAQAIVSLLYFFFRLATGLHTRKLANPAPYFAGAGWRREKRREFDWGLLACELWRKL